MLDVSNLTRRYGSFVAVDKVNFSIGKGEIIGLLGHNGAGKTTIMKMLSGYLEPNEGSITVDGMDLATDTKKIQRLLGYLPENLPIYPEMTVADYLDYAAELKGIKGQEKISEIKRAITATDIGEKLLAPIATLSRGFKQRVGVAQAILGKPKILILDEPTNGLDPTQTDHMRQLIKSIALDATVILSTHIMQEVDAICDRVLIVRNGQLIIDERLEELRNNHQLRVVSSLSPPQAGRLFELIDGIENVENIASEADPQRYHYRLRLATGAVQTNVCANIARQIISEDAELFQLQPEQRDLETLFREVSQHTQQENLNDAA
ncbi:ABC transporter ATP-binding protein [Gynuella sunshinyii]|uniref:ABC-type multidrug transport system, ATPase component n=1 Tax=Gynuella sunshinyii YC6258 TaxID=1445510 RepID=A0A0C5VD73_9GAMM|nr:ABC transporter ATP-binding protein [Gynuella sunshinyii]AJQ97260.1 ABC-type multidrug transport system, ATPase component [Gynuella sunshinyii YC6258]